MREGGILNVRKSWIDLKEGLIIIPGQAKKRERRDKRVPINSVIRPIVERLLKKDIDSDYLFVNPKTQTRYTKIQNSWTTILEKAGLNGKLGVDRLRFHDLRHTQPLIWREAGRI